MWALSEIMTDFGYFFCAYSVDITAKKVYYYY